MKFKFEKIQVWQKSMDYAEIISKIAKVFPKDEFCNLNSQIRRAADGIGLRIAEGAMGQSNAECRRYISYALRSIAEVVTCLIKARNRKYIDEDCFDSLYAETYDLMNMLIEYRNKL